MSMQFLFKRSLQHLFILHFLAPLLVPVRWPPRRVIILMSRNE
jgi:hypothetical protein